MADNLPVLTGGLFPSRLDRQLSRALERIDASTALAIHRDQARMDRVAGTAERGMVRAAQLGSLEVALAQSAPHAAGYVHAVATAGALGIASVVYEAGRGI